MINSVIKILKLPNPQDDGKLMKPVDPLQNSLILSEIFSHIPDWRDLKAIRLVSKLWRDTSLSKWRNRGTLRLLWRLEANIFCGYCLSKKIGDVGYIGNASQTLDIPQYLEILRRSGDQGDACPYQLWRQPFTRYRIINCSILQRRASGTGAGVDVIEDDPSLARFFKMCGPHMKYLHLDHCQIPRRRFKGLFRWIFSNKWEKLEEIRVLINPDEEQDARVEKGGGFRPGPAPRLRTIWVGLCKKYHKIADLPNQEDFTEMIRFTPKLRNLTVGPHSLPVLQAIRTGSDGQHVTLERLSLPEKEVDHLGYRWLKAYLQVGHESLHHLEIYVGIDSWVDGAYKEVLKSCQGSLSSLIVRGKCPVTAISCGFGGLTFIHLTKLQLFGEEIPTFWELRGLIHLKYLEVNCPKRDYGWNTSVAKEAEEEATRLEWTDCEPLLFPELEYVYMDHDRFNVDSLWILGRWMPNVRRAHLILHRSTRKVVPQIWPQLEELTDVTEVILDGYHYERSVGKWLFVLFIVVLVTIEGIICYNQYHNGMFDKFLRTRFGFDRLSQYIEEDDKSGQCSAKAAVENPVFWW